jgi:hypothetical protein
MKVVKKFKLVVEEGTSLKRLVALRDFGNVKKGDKGGLVEKDANLSHNGDAWVFGDAWVSGNARVFGDAWVSGDAQVSGRIDLTCDIDFELTPRIKISNTKEALALKKALSKFIEKEEGGLK